MKSLISDVFEKEKKKSPIKEKIQAIEEIKNEEIYYYKDDKDIEIDFIVKLNCNIIPIEVKSGKRTKSTSLNNYIKIYKPDYSIRISTKNFGFDNGIKAVPLYAVVCI